MSESNVILYRTKYGKAAVSLYARDGSVWMNQAQLAELFATAKQNISLHINNIIKNKELNADSVVKDYLTTADVYELALAATVRNFRTVQMEAAKITNARAEFEFKKCCPFKGQRLIGGLDHQVAKLETHRGSR